MKSAFITHPDCWLHKMGPEHVESPNRLSAIKNGLIEARLLDLLAQYEAPKISRDQILLVHDENYLTYLHKNLPESGMIHLNMDTIMSPHTLDAAYRAAGAITSAVDLVMAGEIKNAFCAVRPPGHHAEKSRAMGFCFFNNVAIGAAYALKKYDLKKVVILDFDVHHGNGTESMLGDDERVLICSSFQCPHYPGKEFAQDNPRIINVPLTQGTSSEEFREAITKHWFPTIQAFNPEFFFISAGFDAHRDDPLAELNLTTSDFGWLAEKIIFHSNATAQGRVISTLEGGYNIQALSNSVVAYLRPFLSL